MGIIWPSMAEDQSGFGGIDRLVDIVGVSVFAGCREGLLTKLVHFYWQSRDCVARGRGGAARRAKLDDMQDYRMTSVTVIFKIAVACQDLEIC